MSCLSQIPCQLWLAVALPPTCEKSLLTSKGDGGEEKEGEGGIVKVRGFGLIEFDVKEDKSWVE